MAKRQGQEALLLKFMGSYIEPASRGPVSLGADRLNSPQTMRAVLEVIAPQGYPGGHALMVDEIHHGSLDSLTMRMLWLLIYFETNNMINGFDAITGCKIDFSLPGKMLEFLRQMGFLTKANIAWLATSSSHTNQMFLKRLLDHAIFDENSIDVLGWLIPEHFKISHLVKPSDFSRNRLSKKTDRSRAKYSDSRQSWPLLYASSLAGNTEAVRLLLELGAEDTYEPIGPRERSPLECAASLEHDNCALVIMDLLLSKPVRSTPQRQITALEDALELAIERSHTKLLLRLLSEFDRRGHGTISSRYATLAVEYANYDTIRILVDQNLRSGSESIDFPGTILFSAILGTQEVGLDCLTEKLTFLLSYGADPAVRRCEKGCGRGFILDYVIHATWTEEEEEGENIALVLAELMRKHGCPPVRPKPVSGPDYDPSALQLAICMGYPRLTEYLLDWGVDIDHYQEDSDCVCVECDVHDDVPWDDVIHGCSPLLTALEHGQTEIAKMLLERNPNLKLRGGERELAVELDDTELVTTLLQAGSTNIEEWSKLLITAISCKSPKSTRILLSMSNKDFASIDDTTILQASLLIGDTEKAYQQAAFCSYDSQNLFEAVLQSHISKDYHKIVERILNGRRPSPNDDFELGAVASAAIHNDAYLMCILMKCMGQGPWIVKFPDTMESYCAEDGGLFRWDPNNEHGLPKHILNYAAELDKYGKDSTVLQTMLDFGITANGMYLDISGNLTAESWKQLITAGADPIHGHAIHDAARGNMLEHVKVLCEAKVPLNTVQSDKFGRSRAAVQSAVESHSPQMLQLLLDYGAQVECPAGFDRGATCLQLAAGAGDIGLVCLLLDKGAKVNAKRALFSGRTAIEIAAEHGRLDILRLLLLRGEQLFQTAAERHQFIRAASLAEWEGHEPLVEVLRQHINWNDNDQRLFEQSKKLYDERNYVYLDDMTEKLLDSERQRADERAYRQMEERNEGRKSAYDMPGFEEWLGESTEEEADDNQTGELIPAYQHVQDGLGDRTNLCGDLAGEHPARQSHAWGSGAETRESLHTLAAQAFHYQDSSAAWFEIQDNDIDMMQDLSGGMGDLDRTWQSLGLGIETQNHDMNQEPGMVLGEVVDGEDYSQLNLQHEFDMMQGLLGGMGDLDRPWESLGFGIETQDHDMNQEPRVVLEDVISEENHSQLTSGHELASAYLDDWWI